MYIFLKESSSSIPPYTSRFLFLFNFYYIYVRTEMRFPALRSPLVHGSLGVVGELAKIITCSSFLILYCSLQHIQIFDHQ